MGIPVEAIYNYHFNGSIELDLVAYTGYFWNPQSFGGMTQDPTEGDIIIAMMAARTDTGGSSAPVLDIADDSGNTRVGVDWVKQLDFEFDDDGSGFLAQDPQYTDSPPPGFVAGGHYAVAVFTKVWTIDDDPASYDAYFTAIRSDFTGFDSAFAMGMYCIHGGDGHVSVSTGDTSVGWTQSPGTTFTRNFGDGTSWGWKEPSDQSDGFGVWGYYPGVAEAIVAGTGATVYCRAAFGKWAFVVKPESYDPTADGNNNETEFLEPYDSLDQDWGSTNPTNERDPLRSFTVMLDDFAGTVVRASRRFSAIHKISVS